MSVASAILWVGEAEETQMGRSIATGVDNQGHLVTFDYEGETMNFFMKCVHGKSMEVKSFRSLWSIKEVLVRFDEHLKELSLNPKEAS